MAEGRLRKAGSECFSLGVSVVGQPRVSPLGREAQLDTGWAEMRRGKVKAMPPLPLLRIPLGGTPVTLEAKTQAGFRRVKKEHMSHAYTDHIARLSCGRQVAI